MVVCHWWLAVEPPVRTRKNGSPVRVDLIALFREARPNSVFKASRTINAGPRVRTGGSTASHQWHTTAASIANANVWRRGREIPIPGCAKITRRVPPVSLLRRVREIHCTAIAAAVVVCHWWLAVQPPVRTRKKGAPVRVELIALFRRGAAKQRIQSLTNHQRGSASSHWWLNGQPPVAHNCGLNCKRRVLLTPVSTARRVAPSRVIFGASQNRKSHGQSRPTACVFSFLLFNF